ncbi:MAG: hypothetical protein LBT47_01095 [Deltaproteobacteria bacterium]|jgi:hypothetical protein|nr:hypothetical protein [Deltaproteobacteria bacterium]
MSDIDTKIRAGNVLFSLPIAANTKLEAGTIAAVNAAGYLVPAVGAGLKIPGRVEETVDNTGGTAGEAYALIRRSVVGLAIGVGINQAAVGTMVYFADNHTVKAAATTASPAGILLEISEGLAWVDLQTATPGSIPVYVPEE